MACNCEILVSYTIETEIPVTLTPFVITPSGIVNGKESYEWIDETLGEVAIIWDNETEQWSFILVSTGRVLAYLENLINSDCPSFSVNPVESFYTITSSGTAENLTEFFTYLDNCTTPEPICYSWESVSNTFPEWFTPWNFYTLVLPSGTDYNDFYVGQVISNLESTNPFIISGAGTLTVASLIFISPANIVYHEPIYGAAFYGIVLKDEFGTLLIPGLNNLGQICPEPFIPPIEPTQDEINKECFDILVWNKQCEFGKCVLSFLNKLQLGIYNCEEFEKLKNKKRVLEILNCYDTRDIEDNTTVYNNLTYSQIKKLLNY